MPATEYDDIKERVSVLDDFFLEDEQPSIEADVGTLLFDPYSDYDFADRNAYESRWAEEASTIAQIVTFSLLFIHSHRSTLVLLFKFHFTIFLSNNKKDSVLKKGEEFIDLVYTYRSVSKALPQVSVGKESQEPIFVNSFGFLLFVSKQRRRQMRIPKEMLYMRRPSRCWSRKSRS